MNTNWRSPAPTSLPAKLARTGAGVWRAYRAFLYRRSIARTLQSLDDRVLKDIGISRGEIEAVVAGVTVTTHAWRAEDDRAFPGKSPCSLHTGLKQLTPASATIQMQGECCGP